VGTDAGRIENNGGGGDGELSDSLVDIARASPGGWMDWPAGTRSTVTGRLELTSDHDV
jgi:hypothetical protein